MSKPMLRRNRSNTIPKVNKTVSRHDSNHSCYIDHTADDDILICHADAPTVAPSAELFGCLHRAGRTLERRAPPL
jgi:hypothetical protein